MTFLEHILYARYLELAILRCWRFLDNNFTSILQRLVMMMRGIADPLASAYCHLYLANSARFLCSGDDGKDEFSYEPFPFSQYRILHFLHILIFSFFFYFTFAFHKRNSFRYI